MSRWAKCPLLPSLLAREPTVRHSKQARVWVYNGAFKINTRFRGIVKRARERLTGTWNFVPLSVKSMDVHRRKTRVSYSGLNERIQILVSLDPVIGKFPRWSDGVATEIRGGPQKKLRTLLHLTPPARFEA